MIKLSIITINRNNVQGLEKTMKSVFSQTSHDFEYIIIDGVSTDGSKELLERLAISDKRLTYWCSAPDTGIYNAMNKGIKQATGEYCLFLNAGDSFADENVVTDFVSNNFIQDIVYGDINHFDIDKYIETKVLPDKLSLRYFCWQSLPHQSSFIRKILFEKLGLYNEKLKFFADWEFVLKALVINNCSYIHYSRIISNYDINGVSTSRDSYLVGLKEQERVDMFNTIMPFVYEQYTELTVENEILKTQLSDFQNLRNGRLGFLIKLVQYIKRKKCQ